MPHLSSVDDFKRIIVNKFLRDRQFVDLVTNSTNHGLPASDLLSRQVFLYDYVDGTVQADKVFVCVEADDNRVKTPAVSLFDIYITIAVPKSMMDMNGKIRRDAIAQRIDEMLNGSTEFGFGKLERKPGGRLQFSDAFRAKLLHYSVENWNRHGSTL